MKALVDLGADSGAVTADEVGWSSFSTASTPPGPSVDPLNHRAVIELSCP